MWIEARRASEEIGKERRGQPQSTVSSCHASPKFAVAMWIAWIAAVLSLAVPAAGQGTQADYRRAADLRRTTAGTVLRDRVQPNWIDGGRQFWYRIRTDADRYEVVLVDVERGVRTIVSDPARQAALVHSSPRRKLQPAADGPKASTRTGAETTVTFINRTEGRVELVWLDPDGRRHGYGTLRPGAECTQHTFAGHVWLLLDDQGRPLGVFEAENSSTTVEVARATPRAKPSPDPAAGHRAPDRRPDRPESLSPDGRLRAFIRDHNVWIADVPDGRASRLSTDGVADDGYRGAMFWSPDSKKLVAMRTRSGEGRKVSFIESSPSDGVQPKLHTHEYAKPGDRIPVDRPQLFDMVGKRRIPVSDALMPNPWSIDDVRWDHRSRWFTCVYNQRGHQVLRLLAVDAADGSVRPIIDEHSPTFIDYSGKFFLHYLDDTGEVVWMSERDGWNHLYLIDVETGKVKNQITRGPWVVRGVDRVDAARRQVWFRAGGIRPGQDPYYVHYCRVDLNGAGLTVLTEGDGNHSVEFSPDGRCFADRFSRVDLPPVAQLRRSDDGRLIVELERADWDPLLATGWKPPERFVAKGRDGTTDIYGVIFRPSTFDPRKRYPVIEMIYAGPQDSFVPKDFIACSKAQEMAELGFVVVEIDGMGTSNRSKRFHDVCWKNLADAGFPDRILWIRAAGAQRPWMDLGRVGIFGGSAGGQNAACAVMTHGDFYKVAVADCGCHDNRMDKIWWNEQWMGWPVGPEYAANSNVTLARGLTGKLLLIVGEMDRNVDPASTLQVVDALIKADKDFELLVIPGAGHGAAETPYGSRRRADFFVRHLLGVGPRGDP